MALPLILAGPILRRADENVVCVWIATSFDPALGLELNILDVSDPKSQNPILATSLRKSIRAGENLYVSLILAYPDAKPPLQGKFPKDTLLAYELWFEFERAPGVPEKLELSQLLESPYNELCYQGELKPTFYLQGKTNLSLMHGSCRKPHGDGDDALPAADTLIGNHSRELGSRPCVLCLTGDQIYANAIHADTLKQIHRVLPGLFGYDESVPTHSGSLSLKDLADVTRKSKRAALARKAGLNPDEWPLFGLGEMLVMYFLSWNSALWDSFTPVTKLKGATNVRAVLGLEQIKNFIKGLPAVMRAMANAPVYMIFDDHEVSDDWNLHRDWHRRVRKSDLGRRMVTNALVAYWLCQGWGNDPSRFEPTFEDTVKAYCELLRTRKGKVPVKDSTTYDEFFWDFHGWGFVTPTTPPVSFLDTRTQRDLFKRGRAPRLLGKAAWRSFLGRTDVKGGPLVIVAPTPVFGMLFTEAVDKQTFLDDGPEEADFEHWRFNQDAHHQFLKGLIQHFTPSYCVFLSGDVHASFTAEVDYMLDPTAITADTSDGPPATERKTATRFYQFTSSPLKNENHDWGAQVDATNPVASELLDAWSGIPMWESWDLVGFDNAWRNRAAAALEKKAPVIINIYDLLYVQFMDGLRPDDPFVTPSKLVATDFQQLRMGRPLWREIGRYYRHFKKDSDDAPFYPYNNIGLVTITARQITHELCSVKTRARLMPVLTTYPYTSTLP